MHVGLVNLADFMCKIITSFNDVYQSLIFCMIFVIDITTPFTDDCA